MRLLLDAHVSPAVARQLEREGIEEWAETGRHHAGVVLVDEKTIRPSSIGVLIRALRSLVVERGDESWQDRVVFLRAR